MTMAGTTSEHRENPHISDEEFERGQSAVIKDFVASMKELEDKLSTMKDAEVKASTDNHDKLKPIDIKDIERPDKYDDQAAKFNTWFDKFKDLLTSRNGNWEKLPGLIDNRGKVTIKRQKEFIKNPDDANYKSFKEQSDTYAQPLKRHLTTYTDGELHARVIQTNYEEVMELMREVIYKGRRTPTVSSTSMRRPCRRPRRTGRATSTRFSRNGDTHTKSDCGRGPEIQDGRRDDANNLVEDHAPRVREGREQLAQGKHEDDYFSFEKALFDEINMRKMEEESRKKSGRINVLNNSSGEDDKLKRNADGGLWLVLLSLRGAGSLLSTDKKREHEEVEIWSEEWQCNICGLAQKRSRSRSRGEDDEQDRPTKAPRDQELQRETRARVEASGLVARAGCAEGHTSRESAPTWAQVDRRIPSPRRGHRSDHEVFQDRLQDNGTLGFPCHTMENDKGKSKGKGKGGKGDKGKGKGQ